MGDSLNQLQNPSKQIKILKRKNVSKPLRKTIITDARIDRRPSCVQRWNNFISRNNFHNDFRWPQSFIANCNHHSARYNNTARDCLWEHMHSMQWYQCNPSNALTIDSYMYIKRNIAEPHYGIASCSAHTATTNRIIYFQSNQSVDPARP